MLAVSAVSLSSTDPLAGLQIGERPEPEPKDGWSIITMRTSSLNRHDLWSLKGVGLRPDQLPRILGCDGAGIDENGNEVVIHSIVTSPGWSGPDPLDPHRTMLSEGVDGTFAEKVLVPTHHL
ncbi:MAG: Zn-dependent oxidoreductase, partial [Propionibacteriaceae bacterium]|nr:Zn-dependent oxidoreductase [Propionibacteriaceae bacterium]